jgi:glutamate-1-semialdehyde 2,1-aminomutase
VARVGSMMTLFFSPDPVTNWPTASRCDTKSFANYFWGLLNRGIYMPCSQFEALFVSAVHTDADIKETAQAARDSFANLNESQSQKCR